MSAPTPETLAELRRLLDEAPPLPYRDRPATHGDPSNGPTYVALEAQWEGRWEEVATGSYEKWCGMGIALAAAAVNALPALLDAAAERDALADRLDIAEAGLDRVAVAMGCGDEVDGRGVYRDDVDGMIEYATTLRQAARDHDECPVLCAEHDGPEAWEWPMSCQDCRGSGMAGPSVIDFIDGVVPDNLAHPGECESCAGSGRDCNSIHNLVTMDDARQMVAVVLDDLAVAEARMADVRALHRPAYNDTARSQICPDCDGKAGVHPCGCWADTDYEPVCAVCNQGHKGMSVPWPCETIRAIDGAES